MTKKLFPRRRGVINHALLAHALLAHALLARPSMRLQGVINHAPTSGEKFIILSR